MSLRRILIYLLFAIAVINGMYKFLGQSIPHKYWGWDLRNHIKSVQETSTGAVAASRSSQNQAVIPPYMPSVFLFSDFMGRLDWNLARLLWLVFLGSCLGLLIFWRLRDISKLDSVFRPSQKLFLLFSVIIFKGTYLAIASGNMALAVAFLLIAFVRLEKQNQWLAIVCLALASMKHLALPFYCYLLVRGKYRVFLSAAIATIALNVVVSNLYLGPSEHARLFFESIRGFESQHTNSYLLMGSTGRVDLAPLLAVFGIKGTALTVVLAFVLVGGIAAVYRYRNQVENWMLLFNLNVIFFAVHYHRDYDVVLLLILALPFVWRSRNDFKSWHLLGLLPAALPLQYIHKVGTEAFHQGEFFFNFIGTSTIISIAILGYVLNKDRFAAQGSKLSLAANRLAQMP